MNILASMFHKNYMYNVMDNYYYHNVEISFWGIPLHKKLKLTW